MPEVAPLARTPYIGVKTMENENDTWDSENGGTATDTNVRKVNGQEVSAENADDFIKTIKNMACDLGIKHFKLVDPETGEKLGVSEVEDNFDEVKAVLIVKYDKPAS